MGARTLVVDDEESIRFTFESFLSDEGYEVVVAQNYDEANARLMESEFDLIFLDIILEGKSGIDLMQAVNETRPNTPVIMITGVPSIESAAEALRLGALDYIIKPIRQDTLLRAASLALKHKAMADEKERCRTNYEAIFKSVEDGIITVDEDISVLEINEAASRICGIQRREAVGKPFRGLATGCSGRCLQVLEKTVRTREKAEVRNLKCLADIRPRQVVSVKGTPLLKSQDRFSGGVMVIRDETRLSDLERSLWEHRGFRQIVGKSKEIEKVKSLIKDLADTKTTVLITGESGTGKELVVEALHYSGARRDSPLVKVNCGGLAESILESELFGHVRGAFTGAVKDKIGRFQRAHGGTIFLDEVGEISPRMQLRLLRVIETMDFERVGDSRPIRVDVRIVAATNRDLKKRVSLGQFREDLYYRLNVVEIHVPPLKVRRDDIPLLVDHFLKKLNEKLIKNIAGLSPGVYRVFMNYHWPGNVRELLNALEHACIHCRGTIIHADHLPLDFKRLSGKPRGAVDENGTLEAETIRMALGKSGWNKSGAARILGISRRTIYRKIDKYGITLSA